MFRALRVRNYRIFASANLVSLTGTWMQRIGQDWLALQLSGDSGVALGLLTALQFAPTLVLSMYGGVLADRYDKRRVLVITQALMGVLALAARPARRHRRRGAVARLRAGRRPGRGLGHRRPGAAGVRLGDGRPGAPDQRGEPELLDLQRRPAGRARGGRRGHRRGVGQHRSGVLHQRRQLRLHHRRPARHAGRGAAPEPARRPGPGSVARGSGVHVVAPRPGAGHGARLRDRHLRLQLPGHDRAHVPRGVRPRRPGVRAPLHLLRRRLAVRGAAVHPAQRPAPPALPRGFGGRVRRPHGHRRADADVRCPSPSCSCPPARRH